MTDHAGAADDLLTGALAPPMANGEVVFEVPWQGRVFGIARALADAGVYGWNDFRACLIEEIGGWNPQSASPFAYYDHFLHALERLLEQRGLVDPQALRALVDALDARPHGHDHHHGPEDHGPEDHAGHHAHR